MRFPGQWFQLETGFHHNWHRTYDPTTGRYLQPDPLGMPDGPSRWAYARSAPTMYVDPTGQIAPLAAWAIGAAATAWIGVEIGLTAYDAYSLYDVYTDPCSTFRERALTTVFTGAGVILPGAGYTNPRLQRLADEIGDWLGEGTRFQPTPRGARQFISEDNQRVIRFDIEPGTYPPSQRPHINIEDRTRPDSDQLRRPHIHPREE